ncbi:OsmC family protein [Micromonospora sp. NBC_00858]|uniref:OsmC family protein n=1 Tax=Micromonospora sp. NBC_00858 TaxID=2975979 RepID=UPI00386887F5|nr:OsmC family protein [Micromonospora sp. NBC_00858]
MSPGTSFTPVELLLAAIGGCTAIDVDHITRRRAEPTQLSVVVSGDKIRDETGGRLRSAGAGRVCVEQVEQ